ncbi:unnamed protein product [Paramecium primaurelia]|uniref:Uncharacterized protein n=1 Tax=Paramecium primaurelia TaxID=5886 RepID=A0A8S1QUA1_PARPR|nr:unnamed protein product [Paramecium primaurelia]
MLKSQISRKIDIIPQIQTITAFQNKPDMFQKRNLMLIINNQLVFFNQLNRH